MDCQTSNFCLRVTHKSLREHSEVPEMTEAWPEAAAIVFGGIEIFTLSCMLRGTGRKVVRYSCACSQVASFRALSCAIVALMAITCQLPAFHIE